MIPEKISSKFSHAVLVTGARTWNDEQRMRAAFNQTWLEWGVEKVTRPVLLFGSCPTGADAMAQRLWRDADLETIPFPADWGSDPRAAGLQRNQRMVNAAQVFRDSGAQVVCIAFLDACQRGNCPQRSRQQLMPAHAGHFSHGTVHCRSRALTAGFAVVDVLPQDS